MSNVSNIGMGGKLGKDKPSSINFEIPFFPQFFN